MSEAMIDLEGVEKTYRFFRLSNLSMRLAAGQIMGFVGPNGAGKSTTIRILMAMIRQDRDSVRVLGRVMPREQAAATWDIGCVSEDMRLHAGVTLAWHMQFVASIYPGWDATYAETLLRRFNLHPEQPIKVLSHGERVKATLCCSSMSRSLPLVRSSSRLIVTARFGAQLTSRFVDSCDRRAQRRRSPFPSPGHSTRDRI